MSFDAFVRDLGTLEDADPQLLGGKAASLAQMTRAGLNVPPGYIVTTDAFTAWLGDRHEEIVEAITGLDPGDTGEIRQTCSRLQALVMEGLSGDAIVDAIETAYLRLGPDGPVAVRSSATGEDSADASFAGMQDTYLWVRGANEVGERVRRCWASLYGVESVSYRLHRGLPEEGLSMAVVVQTMVDARSSGVMFTRSPLTGDRSVVTIEASWGLGSAVVGGEVTPDAWTVNKVGDEVIRRQVSTKLRRHRPGEGGVIDEDVPADLRDRPSLSDDELAELVAVGRRVEAFYGCAQDVEWAIDHEGRLFLLQSRPETVWSQKATSPVATAVARPFDHVISHMAGRQTGESDS